MHRKINSLVYARVLVAHKDMDPEVECFDEQTRKAKGFGELKGCFIVSSYAVAWVYAAGACPSSHPPMRTEILITSNRRAYCFNSLLDTSFYLLPLLGSRIHLETAIGMNGRVWINTKSAKDTIAVARCIDAADPDGGNKDESQMKQFVASLDL